MAFIEGFGIGLATLMFIGPVLFTMLQATLGFGFKSGLAVITGIIISDVVAVVLLTVLGAGRFFEDPDHQFIIGIIGALILFGMGLKYLISPAFNTEKPLTIGSTDYIAFFLKGFLVNLVNPFVFAVWIGIIGLGSARYGEGGGEMIFLAGVLAGIFSIDFLKLVFASKLQRFLKPSYLIWIYRVLGLLMIGFGIRMIFLVV
jgi:threonine/homoserine/homoserine lactone efflux protein